VPDEAARTAAIVHRLLDERPSVKAVATETCGGPSVECPGELTYGDFMALDAFLFTSINLLYRDYQLAQEGFFSESDWKRSVDTYVHWYLANPFGRAWWDEEAKGFFPEEFAAYVGNRLDSASGRDSHSHWLAIRARVTGEDPAGPPTVCKARAPAANE
jgi:hypothetical protein